MTSTESLTVSTPSDREIAMTRGFEAPRHLVFDALTKPELLSVGTGRPAGRWSFARSISAWAGPGAS
jgi:uncharacterized protein YndB with AHSA1/START domain